MSLISAGSISLDSTFKYPIIYFINQEISPRKGDIILQLCLRHKQTKLQSMPDMEPRLWIVALRRYDNNRRSQMQGGINWILPKEINANRFFWDSHWLEIWQNLLYPSMWPKGGSVAMDFEEYGLQQDSTSPTHPLPVTHCLCLLYFDIGKGGEYERRLEGLKLGQNTNRIDCISSL